MTAHLDPKKDPARRVLKVSAWPEADRQAWDAALIAESPLEPGGAVAHWAPQTRHMAARAYGRWLAWLAREGRLADPSVPGERATPELLRRYIAELRMIVALSTTISYITYLELTLQALAPDQDFHWIRPLIRRLKRTPAARRSKRERIVASDELCAYGLELMHRAEENSEMLSLQRASLYRDGLMLSLLAAAPVRRGNFSAIEIGRHLVHRHDGYWLRFNAAEVKNRIALEMPIPATLVPYLELYISKHRPVLCGRPDVLRGTRLRPAGDHLWVTNSHSAMSAGSVYGRIMALTQAKFGRGINPHLFRDSAATSIAVDDPVHVYITKCVLGHTTLRTSEKYYNQANSMQATRHYQAHMQELRRKSAHEPPQVSLNPRDHLTGTESGSPVRKR